MRDCQELKDAMAKLRSQEIEAQTLQPIQDKDRGESPEGETNREGHYGDAAMYNIVYKCGDPE